MRFGKMLAAALALGLPIAGAVAEDKGTLVGRVRDAVSGGLVDRARVSLEPGRRIATSSDAGEFSFNGLDPGSYRIEIQRIGYAIVSVGPLQVLAGGKVEIEVRLQRLPLVEEVVVQSESDAASAGSAQRTASAEVADEETLRMPGTLGDPIRGLTSVPAVAAVNDFKAEVRIRGGEPEDTLFRLDGVTIDNPYHFRWARGSTAALNPDAFEEIRVRVSGVGAEIGDAQSGVIELIPNERGKEGMFLNASLGTLATSLTGGGGIGSPERSGSWLVGGRYSNLAIYRSLYNIERVSVPDFGDLVLRSHWPLSDRLDLVGGALALRNGLSTSDPETNRRSIVGASAGIVYAGLDAKFGATGVMSGRFGWTESHQKVKTAEGDNLQSREGRLQLSLEVSGGAGVRWRAGIEGSRLDGMIAGALQTATGLMPLDAGSERVGGYVSLQFDPTPASTLVVGARADRDSRFGAAPLQPRLSWEHAGPWRLKTFASAGRYAQFPRFNQEFLAQPARLITSTTDEMSAGMEFPIPMGLNGQLTAYSRRLHDIVSETVNRFPDLPEPVEVFQHGTSRGLELSLRKERGRFRSRLAGSLVRARQARDGISSRRNGDQPYRADLSGVYLISSHWSLLGRFQAASGLPYSSFEPIGGGLLELGPLNGRRLPAYARLDLRAAFDWTRKGARGRFYLEADNALGRHNVRGRDYLWDAEKQEYFFRDEESMPLLPGFGVEVSWGR